MPLSRRDLFRALAGAAALPVVAGCGTASVASRQPAQGWHIKGGEPAGFFVYPFLDGVPIVDAAEAHSGEGWVRVYVRNADNRYYWDEDANDTAMTVLHGRVDFYRAAETPVELPSYTHLAPMPVLAGEQEAMWKVGSKYLSRFRERMQP